MEDENIVEMYLARNEDAIRQTASKYGSRLRRISYGITEDNGTSEECENDTYLTAWNLIPPNEPRDYLFAFLAGIIRHISIDRCREKSALKRGGYVSELSGELLTCLPSSERVEQSLDEKELGKAISRFLHTQSKEKRIMFMRRYFYMDSVSEIAKKMSFGESKVKTTLFRMRNDLREYLISEGYVL